MKKILFSSSASASGPLVRSATCAKLGLISQSLQVLCLIEDATASLLISAGANFDTKGAGACGTFTVTRYT